MLNQKGIAGILSYLSLVIICVFLSDKVYKIAGKREIVSNLSGEWHCASINSCNDMSIDLSISQRDSRLIFRREMTSRSGIGSSNLIGCADIDNEFYVYASYTRAMYFLVDGNLVEYFENNNRWNIYTKQKIDCKQLGRYRDYVKKRRK